MSATGYKCVWKGEKEAEHSRWNVEEPSRLLLFPISPDNKQEELQRGEIEEQRIFRKCTTKSATCTCCEVTILNLPGCEGKAGGSATLSDGLQVLKAGGCRENSQKTAKNLGVSSHRR